jgi:hypothetical protein
MNPANRIANQLPGLVAARFTLRMRWGRRLAGLQQLRKYPPCKPYSPRNDQHPEEKPDDARNKDHELFRLAATLIRYLLCFPNAPFEFPTGVAEVHAAPWT